MNTTSRRVSFSVAVWYLTTWYRTETQCVKANRTCVDCLPGKLGQCTNKSTTNENSITTVGVLPPPPCDSTYVCPFESSNLIKLIDAITQPSNLNSSYPRLPVYPPMSSCSPTFTWGNLSSPEFATLLDTTYSEVVHWRRNCFSVPLGKAGRDFVSELSRLYLAYGSASMLESVALKAAIVFLILLLQKLSKGSKTKNHIKCLEKRLITW